MLRQNAKAIHGKEIKDTWHLFTQRRRILLWQVFQMKESGLVAMISRRKVIGLGLMALQLHTETGFQITQATMEAMNIAWSFTIHLRKNGTIMIVPTSSSLCVNSQKIFSGVRYMAMTLMVECLLILKRQKRKMLTMRIPSSSQDFMILNL